MTRANPIQAAFNAGELSPRMAARVDFAKYPNGCACLENLLPLAQGGVTRRPGTRFVAAAGQPDERVRLLGFEFSTEQAYVVEMQPGALRFHKDKGRIEAAAVGAAVTNGGFDAGISGWTDASTGGASLSHDAGNGRLNLNGAAGGAAIARQSVTTGGSGTAHILRFRVHGLPGESLHLRVGSTAGGEEVLKEEGFAAGWHCRSFTPGAGTFHLQFRNGLAKAVQLDEAALIDGGPVEIGAPYVGGELFAIRTAQSADTMYFVHRDHAVRKLTRGGHDSWSLVEAAFEDGPWLEKEEGGITLTPAATSGLGVTLTASAALFDGTDSGRAVRIRHGDAWGWAVLSQVTSATQAKADVKVAFGGTGASAEWRWGAWSARSGHPCAVAFYEQRLCFAGSRAQPQTIWGSQVADFENMRPDDGEGAVEDDDALAYTIAADEVNAARWLSPGNDLVCGTTGGEWIVRASSLGEPLTPTNMQVKRQTTHGSASLPAVRVGHATLFVQRQARKVLEFAFNFEVDGFRAPDFTILADHVTRGGLVDLAYQHEPESILWCVRGDGTLLALTYKRDQDVVAWSRHVLGGACEGGNARVESVAVVPGAGEDELWLAVRRTVDGATRRTVEVMERAYEDGEPPAAAFYVDCGLSYDGAATDEVAGLDHLEGESVAILADGAVHADRTVAEAAVRLDRPAARISVGLPYRHCIETLRLEAGAAAGTASGQTKRVHGVTLVLQDSAVVRVGPSVAAAATIPFRTVGHAMDAAVPLYSGEAFVEFDGDYEADARIVVEGNAPAPFTLLALLPRMKTNEAP